MARHRQMGGIGGQIPPFTKSVLIFLLGLYVIELFATSWLHIDLIGTLDPSRARYVIPLAWTPGYTELWQPLTNYLIQGPSPINALLSMLMVYFFLPTLQRTFGRRGIYRMVAITIVVNMLFCGLLLATGAITSRSPGMGLGPFITAAIVIFGLTRPNAQILLFFVLPVQASWIAWGTGLLAGLFFLSSKDIGSAMWLGGFFAGWLFMHWPKRGGLSGLFRDYKHKRTQKKLRRFTVLDGGKDKDIFH